MLLINVIKFSYIFITYVSCAEFEALVKPQLDFIKNTLRFEFRNNLMIRQKMSNLSYVLINSEEE